MPASSILFIEIGVLLIVGALLGALTVRHLMGRQRVALRRAQSAVGARLRYRDHSAERTVRERQRLTARAHRDSRLQRVNLGRAARLARK